MQTESSTGTGRPGEERDRRSFWMMAAAVLLLGIISTFMLERRGNIGSNALATSGVVLPASLALSAYPNGATDHAVIIAPDEASADLIEAAFAAEGSVVSADGGPGLTVEVLITGNGITAAELRRELAESNSLLLGTGHELLVYEVPG